MTKNVKLESEIQLKIHLKFKLCSMQKRKIILHTFMLCKYKSMTYLMRRNEQHTIVGQCIIDIQFKRTRSNKKKHVL